MGATDLEKRLYLSDNCVSEQLNEEIIILNLSSGQYHELNKLGSVIWETIEKQNPTLKELTFSLQESYNSESIEQDIAQFVIEMIERQLIIEK